ncbi:MAG: extracellular solute-binding protein [Desulfobacterales bacterium]|nr:extracellular solute-binding protein [Desulfobacterales bacterium]
MSITFKKTHQKRIFQDLVDQIETAIIDGSLKPGEKLPAEREMIEMFATSRNTLRESLRVLEQKGLIEIKTGVKGGAIIRKINTEQITESLAFLIRSRNVALSHLAEFREGLEGNIVAIAAERATITDIKRLKAILKDAKKNIDDDWESFIRIDKELHIELARMTGNPIYTSVIKMVYENIHNYYDRFFPNEFRLVWENYDDLYKIVQAVSRRDAKEARSLTLRHIHKFHDYMKDKEQQEHVSPVVNRSASAWSYKEAAKPFAGQTIRVIGETSLGWDVYNNLKSEFEALTGIKIIMENGSISEVDTKLSVNPDKTDKVYDAFAVGCYKIGSFAEKNMIIEIDELFNVPHIQDPNFDPRRDIHPFVWKSSSEWQGKYYGITYEFIPPIIGFRKDLAEHPDECRDFKLTYGYELPNPPKTFLEYYDLIEFFTRKKGRMLAGIKLDRPFYGNVFSPSLSELDDFYNLLVGMGGQLVTTEGKILSDTLINIKALDYFISLQKFAPPDILEYDYTNKLADMASGYIFTDFSYPDYFAHLENPENSYVSGKLSYCLCPDTGLTNALSHTWCISSFSKNREAVWLWLQWITSFDVQKRWQLKGGSTPRLDVMHDPDILKIPYMPTVNDTLNYLVEDIKLPQANDIYGIGVQAVSKATRGELTSEAAMRWAANTQRKLLNQ